jgi:rod shape-determining protein MreC
MWDWLVKHHRHIIVIMILIVSFQLAYSDIFSHGPFVYPSKIIFQGGAIAMSTAAQGVNGLKGIWSNYIDLVHVKKDNADLKRQIGMLRLKLDMLKDVEIKYNNILKILNLPLPHNNVSYVTAMVVGRDVSSIFKSITVNKGELDGIKKGDGVISTSGAVGRVVKLGHHVSEILLLTDINSFIEGVDEQTRVRGIVNGTGSDRLRFLYVLSNAQINKGDVLVTGENDGVFPGGINIGKVIDVKNTPPGWLFKDITVQPEIDINRLNYVMIITGEKQ